MVTLQTFIPIALASFVKSFWCLRISGLPGALYEEDILPDGHHEIIFHFHANGASRKVDNCWISEPEAFFAGQTVRSYTLNLLPESFLYGIRFYPHTLAPLFGFPADLLTNRLLPLEDIPQAAVLKNCITQSPEETFARLETVINKMIYRAVFSSNPFRYVNHCVQSILNQQGTIPIDNLILQAGISPKYLDSQFKKYVGITPKLFSNLVRVNAFVRYRLHNPHQSLTQCSYQANFFDQSHLIKSFKAIAGKAPKDYFGQDNFINTYFSEL